MFLSELTPVSIPKRIISVVPSQTELLFDLGLDEEVIGITKFCIHPELWFRSKTRVGGTKQLKIDLIRELKPDLVIANKEENVREQVEAISKFCPVWVTDVDTFEQAKAMIADIGQLTGRNDEAKQVLQHIDVEFKKLPPVTTYTTAAYLIWKDPLMTVGNDTFIHSMMKLAGFENVFGNLERYPETSIEELRKRKPEYILLSSEPFPFKEKHVEELQGILPDSKILLVDGEIFSWYGSRLLKAPRYLTSLSLSLRL